MDRASSKYKLAERGIIPLIADGLFEIDDLGRIWRVKVRKGLKCGGAAVYPCQRRRGDRKAGQYLQVVAQVDGVRINACAHRVVWHHFNGEIPPGIEVNHRNGLKDDNRPGNLELHDPGQNMSHAHRGGLIDQYGQKNPAAKLTDNQVAQIRLAYSQGGYTQAQLGERFGVRHQQISRIVRGQRRPKQGGPVSELDLRHCATERDTSTG